MMGMDMSVLKRMVLWGMLAAGLPGCGWNDGATGQPVPRSSGQVAQAFSRGEHRVAASDLARWIIEGRQDFQLVDIRAAGDFAKGHIADARNLSLAELFSPEHLDAFPGDRKIILYSNGSEQASAAAAMLRMAGLDAVILVGGYNLWSQRILNPDIADAAADDETPLEAERRAIACYFAGGAAQPSTGTHTPVRHRQRTRGFVPPLSKPLVPPPAAFSEGC
jgi:rhodanese-related sulfurtransferase